jgi:hypothetical protein
VIWSYRLGGGKKINEDEGVIGYRGLYVFRYTFGILNALMVGKLGRYRGERANDNMDGMKGRLFTLAQFVQRFCDFICDIPTIPTALLPDRCGGCAYMQLLIYSSHTSGSKAF